MTPFIRIGLAAAATLTASTALADPGFETLDRISTGAVLGVSAAFGQGGDPLAGDVGLSRFDVHGSAMITGTIGVHGQLTMGGISMAAPADGPLAEAGEGVQLDTVRFGAHYVGGLGPVEVPVAATVVLPAGDGDAADATALGLTAGARITDLGASAQNGGLRVGVSPRLSLGPITVRGDLGLATPLDGFDVDEIYVRVGVGAAADVAGFTLMAESSNVLKVADLDGDELAGQDPTDLLSTVTFGARYTDFVVEPGLHVTVPLDDDSGAATFYGLSLQASWGG